MPDPGIGTGSGMPSPPLGFPPTGSGSGGGSTVVCLDTGTGTGTFFNRLRYGRLTGYERLVLDDQGNPLPILQVPCDECKINNDELVVGRFIDIVDLPAEIATAYGFSSVGTLRLPVLSAWPTCCEYPFTDPNGTGTGHNWNPIFITPPGFGEPISEKLLVRATSTSFCEPMQCREGPYAGPDDDVFLEATLHYDYDQHAWIGCIGRLCLKLYFVGSGILTVELSGCEANFTQAYAVFCKYPLHVFIGQIAAGVGCCDCVHLTTEGQTGTGQRFSRINLDIFGYCDRGKNVRLVDMVKWGRTGTVPVFVPGPECCPPPECQKRMCCDDTLNCVLVADFMALGDCGCFNGKSVLLYPGRGVIGPGWHNLFFDAGCGGFHPGACRVDCLCLGKRNAQFAITLDCSPNCNVVQAISPSGYDCSFNLDVEFEFDLTCNDSCPPPTFECCCPGSSGSGTSYAYLVRLRKYIP